jgi:hypothetical protein
MPEDKTTADRVAAYSDAVFAVIVTIMVLELKAPDKPAFSALRSLWPTAVSYAVSYLFIAIIVKSPLPYAVCRSSDPEINLDQLRPSFHGVAPALRDLMDCPHPARVLPRGVLRRDIRMHRHRVQHLRT